jgi:uncharacterized protein (TIGR02145 family)
MATPDIGIVAANPAIIKGDKAVIYQGVAATLDVTLTNRTGAPIVFQAQPAPSIFEIFMPLFFTDVELQEISIVPPAGWSGSYDSADESLMLTFMGTPGTAWGDGTPLAFSLANVASDAQPAASSIQVNPSNMSGSVPSQVQAPLALTLPPQPGNQDLTRVLQISLNTQGSVYVSPEGDPLPNSLFLNFKNTGNAPIFSGKDAWKTTPQVLVTFVYGLTSGSLAPDSDKTEPQIGSAWNIVASIQAAQGNQWQAVSPSHTGQLPHPVWELNPINTSPGIIGIGDQANISFEFSKIVSFTPVGHTQMMVQFTGFPADDTTNYNDAVYVVDIIKQNPPPTRGLLNFYGKNPLVTVTSPTQSFEIDVSWGMLYVDSVLLICSFPGIAPVTKDYPTAQSLAYGGDTIKIPGVSVSTAIFITLQSFDENGNYLNALQYTVFVNAMEFVDPRDNKVYPVVLIDGLVWMAQNLDWNGPGSVFYNNNGQYEKQFARLYSFDVAQQVPAGGGWRLPSQADWDRLIAAAGSQPYQALIAGGSSGFNAQLGGQADNFGAFSNMATYGYYWSASQNNAQNAYIAQFSSVSASVTTSNVKLTSFKISVRYVRNA